MKTRSQIFRLLVLAGLTAVGQAQEVLIPDPGLNAAVRAALQIPAGPLTAQDLLGLTNLNASASGVTSLEGLQGAYNLTTLHLGDADTEFARAFVSHETELFFHDR